MPFPIPRTGRATNGRSTITLETPGRIELAPRSECSQLLSRARYKAAAAEGDFLRAGIFAVVIPLLGVVIIWSYDLPKRCGSMRMDARAKIVIALAHNS